MLSKFLTKAGTAFAKSPSICLRVISARLNSTSLESSQPAKSDIKIVDMNYPARITDWENFKMPGAPYEGMGPLPPLPDCDEKLTRHYVFPETWFDFLRPRTGESGPYVLFGGLLAMLVSKELYIITPDTNYVLAFIAASTIATVYGGHYVRDHMETGRVNELKFYDQVKHEEITELITTVDDIRLQQWRAQGQDLISDARRSNLGMMLETEYLNRQATVAGTVKKMLDYQVAVQKAETDMEQAHMVNWIETKVKETITPETQKATLDACIARLNSIAPK